MSSVIGARLETRGAHRTSVEQLPPLRIFRSPGSRTTDLAVASKEWGTVAFHENARHIIEIAAVEKGEGYKGVSTRFAVTSSTVPRLSYKDREKISRGRPCSRLSTLIAAYSEHRYRFMQAVCTYNTVESRRG